VPAAPAPGFGVSRAAAHRYRDEGPYAARWSYRRLAGTSIRGVVLDVDGTTTGTHADMSLALIDAARAVQNAGLWLSFATGRPPAGLDVARPATTTRVSSITTCRSRWPVRIAMMRRAVGTSQMRMAPSLPVVASRDPSGR
jgi:haloacid dehalogenase-like hydrolase